MGNIASACKWSFGTATEASNNHLGSTGAGAAFNTHRWGEQFTFMVETNAGGSCSYQIRTARTSSGPWTVLSSGAMSSLALDTIQIPGPLGWLSPRVKTMTDTAMQVIVRMMAVEA